MSQDYPGREQVRALIGNLEIRLLWAHIIRFAGHHLALVVDQESAGLRNAKIRQLHVPFESDHDVLEADVAVNNAKIAAILVGFGVGISQAACDTADDEHCQLFGQRSSAIHQLLGKLLEVGPPDELHRNEVNALGFSQVVCLGNVGVNQVGDQLGFANEVLDKLFLV